MTHLHVPDGVLPVWLWMSGAAATAVIIAVASRFASGPDFRRRLPVLSMTAAFMIVAMSIPVIPAAYHVQLAAVAGIILGPALGVIAAFIVNLLLALVGHGGITTVGLNTIIVGSEVVAGWALFRGLRRALAPGIAAGAAAFVAMVVGAAIMIGVVALSSPQVRAAHLGEMLAVGESGHHGEHPGPAGGEGYEKLSTGRFAALVVILGAVGWILEAVVTGLIVRFAARVKPDLVGLAAAHEPV